MTTYYRLVTSVWPESIDREIIRRGIKAERSRLPTGFAIYRIDEAEISKLPIDPGDKKPYLPCDEDSGFGIYPEQAGDRWDQYRIEQKGTDWEFVS